MDRKHSSKNDLSTLRGDIWLTRPASAKQSTSSLHERSSLRKAPLCEVYIKSTVFCIARTIHDLSLKGVFVEVDDGSGLQEGEQVEVIICFTYKGRQIEHSLPASIVRIQANGVGITFGKYPDRAYTDLVNLLYTK